MTHKNSLARVVLFIFVGLILGGIMSEALGALFGELGVLLNAGGYNNSVHHVFTEAVDFSIGFSGDTPQPVVIDLYLVKFALGIGFKFNLLSAAGMLIALYIMKWSGER
ncbi:MAG: DUF4321 domain-containing protein [Fibrobacter sp.]|nr:DUF4321 domain-containing protein [Fibrobacter sp.]